MPSLGVNIAIVEAGRVLLTRREDFEVWCLPGGQVDDGESLAAAAVREVYEETGLDVSLTRFVGIYSMPHWFSGGAHLALFAAQPVGGALRLNPAEVVEANYFSADALPEPILWWHRQQILDALNGVGNGVAWYQAVAWPFDQAMTRAELYGLRDRSGLSRQQFYLHHRPGPEEQRREVPAGEDDPAAG